MAGVGDPGVGGLPVWTSVLLPNKASHGILESVTGGAFDNFTLICQAVSVMLLDYGKRRKIRLINTFFVS